ncbi:anti-phage deoxyguanosine triphosphatase [Marininema halotolerans]|uniref:Deoxyguanosinetriphosphate triphosphohydrolase-like protein n=1 Tax=Marininema halotolerans TaxID=1155944 RepID=A0A1I6R2R8_9BACL|nr:anti-phage deoxyguanosine triphosphatase [Marininema halotolerans]SFS58924.1 dGTPase [Marininema halotolerans]
MQMMINNNSFYGERDKERRGGGVSRSQRDVRDAFERDYGRIIHSAAFRRLQSKKQVIGTDVGDLHRTRLTHSMEVAQIARGIAIFLNHESVVLPQGESIDISLVEAAALAHDLGHPPFGHEGERSLNRMMASYGGFEGNAQTFRILTRLEGRHEKGLDLTRGLLLSVMKYPILYEDAVAEVTHFQAKRWPPKIGVYKSDLASFNWVLSAFDKEERTYFQRAVLDPSTEYRRTRHLSFECSIIELADDIAYATHDLEDAVNLRLVELEELRDVLNASPWQGLYEELHEASKLADELDIGQDDFKHRLKQVFASLIAVFVNHVECEQLLSEPFHSKRLRYRAKLPQELKALNERLKLIVKERVIHSQSVQALAWKGDHVVRMLFEAMMEEEKLLLNNDRHRIAEDPSSRARVVCDYIAGMTDPYALRMHERLYGTNRG